MTPSCKTYGHCPPAAVHFHHFGASLPFTGADLILYVACGLGLIAAGLIARSLKW
jgi:hypothetical protein